MAHRVWAVALLVLLPGCGIVTSDPAEPSATGGAAGASGTGGTGGLGGATGGGAGTSQVECSKLERSGDPVQATHAYAYDPSLSNAGTALDLVYRGAYLQPLRWKDPWQGALGLPDAGNPIPAAGTLSYAAASDTQGSSPVVFHQVDPSTSDAPCLELTKLLPKPNTLIGIGDCTSGGGAGIYADAVIPGALGSDTYAIVYGPSGARGFGRVAKGGLTEVPYQACAQSHIVAGGWYSDEQGFLIAVSAGAALGQCAQPIAPADRVLVVRFDAAAFQPELRHELAFPDPVMALRTAARTSGGAWLVVQLREPDESTSIHAISLDATGKALGSPTLIAEPSQVAGWALAPFGERAALAWDDGAGSLRFQLLDDATTVATAPLHVEAIGSPTRLALASSPDHDAILSVWETQVEIGSGLRAVRLDCVE